MFSSRIASASLCLIAAALTQVSLTSRANAAEGVFQVEIVADEMCCKGCAQRIAAQLYTAPGVTSVEADVPQRLLTVQAKPSPKLTLQKLWEAVELGKGAPSKLTTTEATYTLTRPDQLEPQQLLPENQYSVLLGELKDKDHAQRIANALYKVRGVKGVGIDSVSQTIFVQSVDKTLLSPWLLAMTVQNAGSDPMGVSGPYGTLTIQWADKVAPATAARQTLSQVQGEIR